MEKRLDILAVERGLAPSRERAKERIEAGQIRVDGKPVTKASAKVAEDAVIEALGEALRYVSRGGLKLEGAVRDFRLELAGKVCLDIGASTGGFTDCMLQNGASRVFAIDVGTDQLAESLRLDPRVTCLEKTNIRYVTAETARGWGLPDAGADFAATDVSFISLTKVLEPAAALLRDGAEMICLIKPQFEAGRAALNKKGVVKEPAVHREVIRAVMGYAQSVGFSVKGLSFSPIKGPEGNIEYLLRLEKSTELSEGEVIRWEAEIGRVVATAAAALAG